MSRNTLASYRRDLDRYEHTLAGAGIDDLAAAREGDVARHLAGLRADGLAPASAARAVSAVRGLHRFAAREGLVATDVARDVKPPAPPRRLPRALDIDQVTRVLAVPGDTPLGLRDRALLEFLYGTGARISEALGADIDDLDLDGDASVTLHGKGGRTRIVPVGRYARAALDAYLVRSRPGLTAAGRDGTGLAAAGRDGIGLAAAGRGTPRIFLNARGGPLSRQSAWTILHRAAAAAGLPVTGAYAVSPHTLRHAYATHLLDGGADVRVVQELLGHASVTTTQVYTLVTVDRLREVYATAHPRAR